MEHEFVDVEVANRVAWMTMERPQKRNALNQAMKQELVQTLRVLQERPDVRVAVLTGTESSFAAGSDVTEIRGIDAFDYRDSHRLPRIWDELEASRIPVIAAVNGLALGGGCELAMACDYRVAAESARFGQPEIQLGLIPGAGGTQRLPRLVGEGNAMRMILTGDPVSASEAVRMGLVDEVVPDAGLRDRAGELAARMARHSPRILELAKEAVLAARRMPLDAGLAHERQLMALTFASEDSSKAMEAFFEGRDPVYGDQ